MVGLSIRPVGAASCEVADAPLRTGEVGLVTLVSTRLPVFLCSGIVARPITHTPTLTRGCIEASPVRGTVVCGPVSVGTALTTCAGSSRCTTTMLIVLKGVVVVFTVTPGFTTGELGTTVRTILLFDHITRSTPVARASITEVGVVSVVLALVRTSSRNTTSARVGRRAIAQLARVRTVVGIAPVGAASGAVTVLTTVAGEVRTVVTAIASGLPVLLSVAIVTRPLTSATSVGGIITRLVAVTVRRVPGTVATDIALGAGSRRLTTASLVVVELGTVVITTTVHVAAHL